MMSRLKNILDICNVHPLKLCTRLRKMLPVGFTEFVLNRGNVIYVDVAYKRNTMKRVFRCIYFNDIKEP